MRADQAADQRSELFPWVGLFILSIAVFVSVTSEFLPTGLLPDIARDFGVSESRVGLLITIFAGTVVISAGPLTALTRRFPRKALVLVVLVIFALGNVLAALAPTYEVLVVARVIGGLAHGLFWSVVGAYSGYLVPHHQIGRAVAITSAGATAAFVVGVPLGTVLGHAVGWRLAFAVIAAVILVLVVLVVFYLPPVRHGEQLRTGEIPLPLRRDRTIVGVVLICLIVIVAMTGQNLFYTYIVPYLIDVVGFGATSIGVLLFAYGAAGAVGLTIAGLVADRFPRAGLVLCLSFVALSVLLLATFHGTGWLVVAALVLWGLSFGGAPAMLQTRMLRTASARIRDVSAAAFTTSFNLAIGGGALIGGLLLDQFGLELLPFVNVALIAAGVAIVVVGDAVLRRRVLEAP